MNLIYKLDLHEPEKPRGVKWKIKGQKQMQEQFFFKFRTN